MKKRILSTREILINTPKDNLHTNIRIIKRKMIEAGKYKPD